MTYNQVRNRVRKICEGHRQVRTVRFGKVGDLEDSDARYAAVVVQDTAGAISPSSNQSSYGFRMFFLDQTHLSEETDLNEQDVLSDCFSIAMDIIAQMAYPGFTDWKVSGVNTAQPVVNYGSDFTGGCYVDLSIATMYTRNVCAVPSDYAIDTTTTLDMDRRAYDAVYTATGDEGKSFTVPIEVKGKKILFLTRESNVMFKTAANPDSTEYVFDGTTVTYGTSLQPGERTLFLFRQY
jgi:hypothetical protein